LVGVHLHELLIDWGARRAEDRKIDIAALPPRISVPIPPGREKLRPDGNYPWRAAFNSNSQ